MRNIVKWQIIALIGIFVVSSCATSNDVVSGNLISKRKYNKGFHLNLHKNYKITKPAEQIEENEAVASTFIETIDESVQQETNSYSSNAKIEEIINYPSSKQIDFIADSQKESVESNRESIDGQQIKPINKNTQKINKFVQQSKDKKSSSNRSDSDVKLVLLVILAFIISPLAMYLADGQTDVWFIVDLILYLMWFSVFFVANLYIASLAAIAIALLRIFGLI